MSRCDALRAGTIRARLARGLVRALAAARFVAAPMLAGCTAESAPVSTPEDVAEGAQHVEEESAWVDVPGGMSVARQGATATRILGGRVLVTGGLRVGSIDTGDVIFDTAEIFDLATGVFSPVAPLMSARRFQHTAAVVGGKVLVVGGCCAALTTSELFDPVASSWEPPVSLVHGRRSGAMVVLDDGRPLVIGGEDPATVVGTAEVLDPASQVWTETGPMVESRVNLEATLLFDGRVLVTGGRASDVPSKVHATAEIFDPATGAWSATASMSDPRMLHTAALLPDGRVLVAGGTNAAGTLSTAEIFDPATEEWTPAPPMATPRAYHTAVLLVGGGVLVTGGVDATASALRSTELYYPVEDRWVDTGLMNAARLFHTATLLSDGSVLAAGGENQSSAEIFLLAPLGAPCEVGPQCDSGACVEGVCCNSACSGQCLTCALPGNEGKCTLAAPGTDPGLDCGDGGACADVCGEGGECVSRVGEICAEPQCVEDRTHAIEAAACVASGSACPTTTTDCAPYLCGEIDGSGVEGCLARCSSIDDCAPGFACDPEGACVPRPDVASADPEACALAAAPGAVLFALLMVRRASRARRRW